MILYESVNGKKITLLFLKYAIIALVIKILNAHIRRMA